jgi:trimeric autotransporter adhesin
VNIGFTTARVLAIFACLIRLSSIASVAQTVTFSPISLSFGNQVQGTASAVKKITLTNNQLTPLHITSIAAHVADYVATSNCPMGLGIVSLPPGASCKISVTFTPSLLGPRTDTLSVTDDGSGSPQTVPLSGSGVRAVSLSPTTVSFKNQVVGTISAATTVTLKNNQTGPLTIWAITTNVSDYSRTTSCPIFPLTLNGGSSCTISVTFRPALTGARSGVLSFSENANFNPTVSLSGTGVSAVVLNPTGLSFGNQAVGTTSAVQAITVTNNQTVGLAITSIATSVSDFMPTSNCPGSPSTLPANASCTVTVAFTPKAIGARVGTLRVTDNASNNPQTASLGGTGLALTLVSIAVNPQSASIPLGKTQPFTAAGTYSDGSTKNLTSSVAWSSSAAAISTVSSAGVATSVSPGTTNIIATSGTITGSGSLQVGPPALIFLSVNPSSAAVPLGTTQQFTATGTYTDASTQNLTSSISWSSSSPSVASVSSSGLATAATTGSATITAISGAITASANLSVVQPALLSIAITPSNPSFALGTTKQLKATGTYSDGSTLDLTTSAKWSSALSNIATVDGQGLATSVSQGSASVTATAGSTSGSTTLTVTPAALVSIAITPAIPQIPLGTTQQFTATGTFTDGSNQNITNTVAWSSNTTGVATISNDQSSPGLATGVSTGSATITAASGSVTGTTTLTVTAAALASIAVTPPDPSIALGTKQQFTATGTFTDGRMQDLTGAVAWSSDTTSTASIDATGLATGAGIGTSTVNASSGKVTGSTVLMVTGATLVSIAINPQTVAVPLGGAPQFTAIGTYGDGTTQNLTQLGHWSSTDGGVATISNSGGTQGLALALSTGTTTIAISSASVSASATLTVGAAALVSIAIAPATPIIPLGTTRQFTAAGTYTDGSIQDVTSTATWSSSSANIAVISNDAGTAGLATGSGLGTTNITAVLGPVSSSTLLTVGNAALVSILVTPISPSIALGFPQQFAAAGSYSDGSTQNLTQSVNWTSSLSTIAAIDAAGLAVSTSIGSTSITATLGSLNASSLLTVNPPVPVSLLVTPINPTVFLGGQQQFAATLVYSNGSSQDVTSGVSWTSSNPTVATVGNGGLVSATASGSATVEAVWGANLLVSSTTMTVPVPTISITPAVASAMLGSAQQFISTVTGSSNQNVSWTVDGVANGNSTIGTISATGLYTAPPMIGSHTIAAIAQSSSSIQATATVTVGSSRPIPNTFFGMHLNIIADPIPASMQGSARIWDSAGAQWPSVNTASGIFNWNKLDTLLADYKLAGIDDVLYTLWRVPQWASSNPTDTNCDYARLGSGFTGECDPPTDLNADGTGSNLIWRTWVQNIAQHVNDPIYLQNHARVKYWESCNECYRSPTLNAGYTASNYAYRGTYAQLVRMMQDARCVIVGNPDEAITALNTTCGQAGYPVIGIDPTAQMVMPDTAPGQAGIKQNPAQVMQNILYCSCANNSCSASSTGCPTGASGSGAVDIIATHLYANTYTPEQLSTQAALVRSYLSMSDLQKPFWSTEGGWGRNTALQVQSDPDLEAAFVARYTLMVWASGTTRAYWYGWDNTVWGTLWGTTATNGCTTQYANGYICMPGIAYQQIHDWLLGAVLTACSVVGTTWDCRLTESTGAPADIVWDTSQSCSSGSCGTIQHSVAPEYIKYRDLTGATLAVYGSMVPVGIKPILVETQ